MNQKSITSFFKQIPIGLNRESKRSLSVNENFDGSNLIIEEKKIKLDEDVNSDKLDVTYGDEDSVKCLGDCQNGPVMISEGTMDLANRIEVKRLSAELKLLSKTLPVLHPNIGISWFKALRCEFDKPYFKKLSKFIAEERSRTTPTFPSPDKVWTWTRECQIDEVKAVILGQDPYHHPGQAHGLSFSVPVGVPPPPSLLNMYKELESDIEGFKKPGHGNLIGWARQGVLLLNAVLTVRCRNPNSHKDQGWEKLTDAVIKHLNNEGRGIVFLLWGAYAQKKADFVDQKKHHLLKSVHPSPLSASRGFLGCRHFSKCNELLEREGKKPIDWSYLPTE